jgi:hypothetical protein
LYSLFLGVPDKKSRPLPEPVFAMCMAVFNPAAPFPDDKQVIKLIQKPELFVKLIVVE